MSIQSPQAKVLDNSPKYNGKIVHVDNEDITLSLNERVVVVDSSESAVTVTLPNIGEAAGKIFTVHAPDGVSNAVTVTDGAGGSVQFDGDYDLDADDDAVALYSDGRKWWTISSEIA